MSKLGKRKSEDLSKALRANRATAFFSVCAFMVGLLLLSILLSLHPNLSRATTDDASLGFLRGLTSDDLVTQGRPHTRVFTGREV